MRFRALFVFGCNTMGNITASPQTMGTWGLGKAPLITAKGGVGMAALANLETTSCMSWLPGQSGLRPGVEGPGAP